MQLPSCAVPGGTPTRSERPRRFPSRGFGGRDVEWPNGARVRVSLWIDEMAEEALTMTYPKIASMHKKGTTARR